MKSTITDARQSRIAAIRREIALLESRRENRVFVYGDIRRLTDLRRELHDLEFYKREATHD